MDNRPTTFGALGHNTDMINHPPHYKRYRGFEVIDLTKQLDFV